MGNIILTRRFAPLVEPTIITDGLLLHLDAGDSNSYPGSGSTWFDISGNGYHGTFSGNLSFTTSDGGALIFNGQNGTHVSLPSLLKSSTNNTGSIEVVFKSSVQHRGAFLGWGDGGTSHWGSFESGPFTGGFSDEYLAYVNRLGLEATVGYRDLDTGNSYKAFDGQIHHYIFTIDGVDNRAFFDGQVPAYSAYGTLNTDKSDFINNSGNIIRVGNSTYSGGHIPFDGNIYLIRIYNQPLSDEQMTQNFNVTKSRFGL